MCGVLSHTHQLSTSLDTKWLTYNSVPFWQIAQGRRQNPQVQSNKTGPGRASCTSQAASWLWTWRFPRLSPQLQECTRMTHRPGRTAFMTATLSWRTQPNQRDAGHVRGGGRRHHPLSAWMCSPPWKLSKPCRSLGFTVISLPCCVVAQLAQLFCSSMYCSLPGSSVHGISQARKLEWVALSLSRGSSQPRDQTHVSCVGRRFFTTEWLGKPSSITYTRPIKSLVTGA